MEHDIGIGKRLQGLIAVGQIEGVKFGTQHFADFGIAPAGGYLPALGKQRLHKVAPQSAGRAGDDGLFHGFSQTKAPKPTPADVPNSKTLSPDRTGKSVSRW